MDNNAQDLKQDCIIFFKQDKFQWFLTIVLIISLFRWLGWVQPENFTDLFKWAIGGLFFAEGLNQASNFSGWKK